jgi:hypothetical protein
LELIIVGVSWGWIDIERTSWWVTIVGLPIALVLLFLAVRQLARRPNVLVGFLPANASTGRRTPTKQTEITAHWEQEELYSKPVTLKFAAYNAGNASAQHLLYNILFPANFDFLLDLKRSKEVFEARQVPAVDDSPFWVVREKGEIFQPSPIDGRPLWVHQDASLHSRDMTTFTTDIKVPRDEKTFVVEMEVSMIDRPTARVNLRIDVR